MRVQLRSKLVADWPKLTWVATVKDGTMDVFVQHGPMVEVNDNWIAEAVWDGPFSAGDFDRTDLVFGSGVRVRENVLIIVTSGSCLDRIWYLMRDGFWRFANSLPALLAVADLTLCEDYMDYAMDADSIHRGLAGYKRKLPISGGEVQNVFYNNLSFNGTTINEVEKPANAAEFKCYQEYFEYLVSAAGRLGDNIGNAGRLHQITPLVTLSKGYDSTAAAVIAKHAGCQMATSISMSSSLWRGSDSGKDIAQALGLDCQVVNRTARHYPFEAAIWAAAARAGTLNWSLFHYPEPLCVLFTGSYGDKVWNRSRREWTDPFAGTTLSHGGIGEFRLMQGVFHCPVPFWGMRQYRLLQDISFTEEMAPWTLFNDYDRPIPRRISEEAGVPRRAFGVRKKNTSLESTFLWPFTPDYQARFRKYLASHGIKPPNSATVWLYRCLAKLDNLIYSNVTRRLGFRNLRLGSRLAANCTELLFFWANEELKTIYQRSLKDGSGDVLR